MRNLNNFMTQNLNLNLEINNSFLYKTKFANKDLEEKYQLHQSGDNKNHMLLGEIMINLGYFASLIYIIFAYYKLVFLLIIVFFWVISLIMIYISHKYVKDTKTRSKILYFLVFLISTALNFKSNLVSIYYTDEINERYGEIIRVIIYDFVSTNLFIIIIDEGNLKSHVFYYFYNLVSIIIAQVYSKKDYFFYLEIITSFFMSFIFYFFRKAWDYKLRSLFAEKFKIEKFFLYTSDFINGLDAYHLNFKNKDLMFLNNKFIHLLEENRKINDDESEFYSKNDIDIEFSNDYSLSGNERNGENSNNANASKFSLYENNNNNNNNKNQKSDSNNDSNKEYCSDSDNLNSNDVLNSNENELNIIDQDKKLKKDLNLKRMKIQEKKLDEKKGNLNGDFNINFNEEENINNNDNKNNSPSESLDYMDIANNFMNNLYPYSNRHIDGEFSYFGKFFLCLKIF